MGTRAPETAELERDERRNEERQTLILRAGVVEQHGVKALCLINNISSRGIQFKYYAAPELGPAAVWIADETAVQGRIAWVKNGLAGMSFAEEMDTQTLLRVQQKLRPNRRRSMPRIELGATAVIRTGGQTRRAELCDISSLGAQVRTRTPLKPGDRAVIEFAGLPSLNAFVRWNDGDASGLAFETPIPMHVIATWIEARMRANG